MTQTAAESDTVLERIADAIRRRDTQTAYELARRSFDNGMQHPLLFNAIGIRLGEQGRHADALEYFLRADALWPDSAANKSAIGLSYVRLEQYPDAVEAFDAALALKPDDVILLCRKAWALELSGELRQATKTYARAIELQPSQPEALGRTSFIAARQGAWSDARQWARKCLSLDPRNIAANLACATADVAEGAAEDAERRLHALLSSELGPVDRYLAMGLLGDLRDRQDRIDEAFAAYVRANDAACSGRDTAGAATMYEAARALANYFDARTTVPPAPQVDDERVVFQHVFLVGFPRSGTTLLETILASHPKVVTLEEKDTLGGAAKAFMSRPEDFESLCAAPANVVSYHRGLYWDRVRRFGAEPVGDAVFVDKTPINTMKLPLIAMLFPEAKVLFAVRDPRDVILSCFRRQFGINVTTREFASLESTARFYDSVMQLGEIYRAKLPLDVIELRLEDLIDDFDGASRALCDQLGLPWDDGMKNFSEHSRTRSIATPSASQVARGLNREGIGQWRRYRAQIAPILPLLEPWIRRFGYAAD